MKSLRPSKSPVPLSCWLALLFAATTLCPAQVLTKPVLRIAVHDQHNSPIAGAGCSLSPTSAIRSAIASASSDEQGNAIFSNISPGTYTLIIDKEGFETLTRAVVVDNSEIELAVNLAVAAVEAKVTVAMRDEASTSVAAGASTPAGNLKHEMLKSLPLAAARIDEALPLVPGVIRSTKGELSIKGAGEEQSALLVNGVNANDPATGNFRLNLPVDSVEAVQIFQHPYTGEYGKFIGGLTQIETRRGSDQWHFELNDFFPDFRFKNGKVVGIAEDTPRLNFNGPLIKDRLYLSQSLVYTISKNPVRGLPFPVNETKSESQSYFTQFDVVLSSRHTQKFTIGYFPQREQYVGLDYFTPQPVTPNYRQRDFSLAVRDHYALHGGLLESVLSLRRFDARVWGQGTAEQTFTPTAEEGNYFANLDRRSARNEFLEIYTFPAIGFAGSHEIKTGFDFNRLSDHLLYSARPVRIVRADGTPAERIEFGPRASSRLRAANDEYSAFIQDRWLVKRSFSIDVGFRYENQRIADENNFAPRAGFAWSPGNSDRTVLRGGIGLFYDKVPLNIRGFSRYPRRTVTHYAIDGETIVDVVEFRNVLVSSKPIEPLDFRHSDRDAGFVPLNLTWNIQLDQKLTSRFLFRANFIESSTKHVYIINPELDFHGISANVLRSAGHAAYRALELTTRVTLPKDDALYFSYVRSRSRGDLNDFNGYFGDIGSPIIRPNQYSNLSFDVPNRFLAWGKISLPKRSSLSPIFEWRSGFPYSVRDVEQNFVGIRNSDSTRFVRFLSLDVDLAKEFRITKKYGVRLSVMGFNLTNHFNPRDVRANVADPNFGKFIASYRRYFTGGFDILF